MTQTPRFQGALGFHSVRAPKPRAAATTLDELCGCVPHSRHRSVASQSWAWVGAVIAALCGGFFFLFFSETMPYFLS